MPKEKKEEQAAESHSVPLVFKRSSDLRLYFTNSVQLAPGNPGEVQVWFGQIVAPPSGPQPESVEVRQDVGITMTMYEFKRMFQLMEKHIPIFEALFSRIQVGSEE